MTSSKVSLNLLIDNKGKRVLFAEAGKDFVDFLFSIPSLPLGTVTRLLTKEAMVGCLGNLYQSIENLSETYMQPNQDKNTLLEPSVQICDTSFAPLLLTDAASSKSRNFYRCPGGCLSCVSSVMGTLCPQCKRNSMNTVIALVGLQKDDKKAASSGEGGGGYVKGVVTYMVMDDLVVKPMSTISSITLLNKFNIKDLGALEERVIDFGMDEIIKLVKASLQSKTVLTDVYFGEEAT